MQIDVGGLDRRVTEPQRYHGAVDTVLKRLRSRGHLRRASRRGGCGTLGAGFQEGPSDEQTKCQGISQGVPGASREAGLVVRTPVREIADELEISVDSVWRWVKLAKPDKCPRKRRRFRLPVRLLCLSGCLGRPTASEPLHAPVLNRQASAGTRRTRAVVCSGGLSCLARNPWRSVRHRSGTPHSRLATPGGLSHGLPATPPKARRAAQGLPACRISRIAATLATRWRMGKPGVPSASSHTVRLENRGILVCFVHVQGEASVLRGASVLTVAPAQCCRPRAWACNAARPSCLGGQMLPRSSRHWAL